MDRISNTYLIAKHLPLPECEPITEPCALCGAVVSRGMSFDDALSDGFMDTAYLGHTNSICMYCAACLGKGQDRHDWIRCSSFIATDRVLLRLKREQIWEYLFCPPQQPFVFGVSYACKKHISFKAQVNINPMDYQVQTENYSVKIAIGDSLSVLAGTIQGWYTICKDTKQEPTWFTKDEILHGCRNYKRIEAYGVDRYFRGEKVVGPYRGTALLELLVFALNKGRC